MFPFRVCQPTDQFSLGGQHREKYGRQENRKKKERKNERKKYMNLLSLLN